MRRLFGLALVPVLALATCGGENVASYSGPVGINLKEKSSDVMNGTVTTEKSITSESGNPYGAFIAAARTNLGGVDPSSVELTSGALLLGAGSTGATALDQVLTGQVDVLFVTNGSNNTYPAATMTNPTGPGPDDLQITLNTSAFSAQDRADLLAGSFKVVLRGPAAPAFAGKSADVDLQTTLNFRAIK
jgi:hypothetical protein